MAQKASVQPEDNLSFVAPVKVHYGVPVEYRSPHNREGENKGFQFSRFDHGISSQNFPEAKTTGKRDELMIALSLKEGTSTKQALRLLKKANLVPGTPVQIAELGGILVNETLYPSGDENRSPSLFEDLISKLLSDEKFDMIAPGAVWYEGGEQTDSRIVMMTKKQGVGGIELTTVPYDIDGGWMEGTYCLGVMSE